LTRKASEGNFRSGIARTDAKERNALVAEQRFAASSSQAAAAIFVLRANAHRELLERVQEKFKDAALSARARQ
jgi:hypothetical protein